MYSHTTITMARVASLIDAEANRDIYNGPNSNGYARVLIYGQSQGMEEYYG